MPAYGLGNAGVRSNKTAAGGVTAANSGTSLSGATVQLGDPALGSPLLAATFINSGGFLTTLRGSNAGYMMAITNSGAGSGLTVTAGAGEGVRGTSTGAFGVIGLSTNSVGVYGFSFNNFGVLAECRSASLTAAALFIKLDVADQNTDRRIMEIQRISSGGFGQNGIGCHINWVIETTTGQENVLQMGVYLPDATSATKISRFYIDGIDGLVVNRNLILNGDGTCSMGDLSGINNATLLLVDDAAQTVAAKNGGNNFLVLDVVNRVYQLGDIDFSNGGTYIEVNDTSKRLKFESATNRFVNIDTVAGSYQIGDIDNSTNATKLSIDDATEIFSFISGTAITGGIKTNQPSATGAGLWLLGKQVAAGVAFDATQYIEAMIDGVLYKLAIAA